MGVANVTFGPIITLSPICTSHTSKQVKLKIVPILYPLDHITLHLSFFLFLSFLIASSKNFITKLVISEYLISFFYCNNIQIRRITVNTILLITHCTGLLFPKIQSLLFLYFVQSHIYASDSLRFIRILPILGILLQYYRIHFHWM